MQNKDEKENISALIVSNIINIEIMYSQGKETELLNALFNCENPTEKVENMIENVRLNANSIINYYYNDGNMKEDSLIELL